jgi:Flp pilus assembly protein TadD
MSRARKLVLAAVGVVLIAGAAVVAYQYDVQKQQQADAAAAMLSLGIAEFNEERYSTALETLSGIQRGTEHEPSTTGALLITPVLRRFG